MVFWLISRLNPVSTDMPIIIMARLSPMATVDIRAKGLDRFLDPFCLPDNRFAIKCSTFTAFLFIVGFALLSTKIGWDFAPSLGVPLKNLVWPLVVFKPVLGSINQFK